MKRLLALMVIVLGLIANPAFAKRTGSGGGSHSVKGHVKKDGMYVQPHRAIYPNNTQRDN